MDDWSNVDTDYTDNISYPTHTHQDTTSCACCGDHNDAYVFDTDTESDDEEPDEDFVALAKTMNHTDLGNTLRESYLYHKRRWRRFTGRHTRHTRMKGRTMRKGKGKGKIGKFGKGTFLCSGCMAIDDAADIYFGSKGKGKGQGSKGMGQGKGSPYGQFGKGPRKNNIGPDGQRMLCGICDSEFHFRAQCPKNPGKGKSFLADTSAGSSTGSRYADDSAFGTNPGFVFLSTTTEIEEIHDNDDDNHDSPPTPIPNRLYRDADDNDNDRLTSDPRQEYTPHFQQYLANMKKIIIKLPNLNKLAQVPEKTIPSLYTISIPNHQTTKPP